MNRGCYDDSTAEARRKSSPRRTSDEQEHGTRSQTSSRRSRKSARGGRSDRRASLEPEGHHISRPGAADSDGSEDNVELPSNNCAWEDENMRMNDRPTRSVDVQMLLSIARRKDSLFRSRNPMSPEKSVKISRRGGDRSKRSPERVQGEAPTSTPSSRRLAKHYGQSLGHRSRTRLETSTRESGRRLQSDEPRRAEAEEGHQDIQDIDNDSFINADRVGMDIEADGTAVSSLTSVDSYVRKQQYLREMKRREFMAHRQRRSERRPRRPAGPRGGTADEEEAPGALVATEVEERISNDPGI